MRNDATTLFASDFLAEPSFRHQQLRAFVWDLSEGLVQAKEGHPIWKTLSFQVMEAINIDHFGPVTHEMKVTHTR
jgi:hypothetical protein